MTPRVYDCVLFAGWGAEPDLLDLRLHELDGVVDTHVVVEADTTFMGAHKEYVYPEIAGRYAAFADRIHYCPIRLEPTTANHRARGGLQWQHRNATTKLVPAGDGRDIFMISDMDEIPRGAVLADLATSGWSLPVQLGQAMHLFWLDLAVTSDVSEAQGQRKLWNGPLLVRRHQAERENAFDLRNIPGRSLVPHGGWHFSFLGDHRADMQKLFHWGDAEVPILQQSRAEHNVAAARDEGRDWNLIRHWETAWVPIDVSYPRYVRERPDIWGRHVGRPNPFWATATRAERTA